MDRDEQERRRKLSKYPGPRELFRFGCFMLAWVFLGVIIELILTLVFHVQDNIGMTVMVIIQLTGLVFPFVALFYNNTFAN